MIQDIINEDSLQRTHLGQTNISDKVDEVIDIVRVTKVQFWRLAKNSFQLSQWDNIIDHLIDFPNDIFPLESPG
jgi:hypothetical protein